jgi:hypothetical protein
MFCSAMHRHTQDSSPILKQMKTCRTVWQIWVSPHNLSCSIPEAHPWDFVEQTSCRFPSFQYLQKNMINYFLVNVQLIPQPNWRPHMGVWPPVYKLLQLFLYCKPLTADHYWRNFKVLVSLSKCFNYLKKCTWDSFISTNSLNGFNHFLSTSSCFLKYKTELQISLAAPWQWRKTQLTCRAHMNAVTGLKLYIF